MIRQLISGVSVVAAALIVGGCVSSGTFKDMEAQKNGEISTLQQQNSALESERQSLEQKQMALQADIDELQQQRASLEQEAHSLALDKAIVTTASEVQQEQYEALLRQLSKEAAQGQLQVRRYQNMLTVDLAEQIFFDSGRATLKKDGKEVLKKVGDALKGYNDKLIWVVGHTDNVPVAKSLQATFPSNWELSVARATNVVRFLQGAGVAPEHMVASGRAEYNPVAPNDTPEDRQKNRRIEIMLIDESLVAELTRPTN
jgi:chemotaxis protein MotB